MKKLLGILVLCLLFISAPSRADDISDFEIEGISIGDSALDFFTERQIKDNSFDYYNDKLFTPVQTQHLPFFNTYDGLDFDFKTNDKDYIIHALYGTISYQENIKDCYKKMDEIVLEMSDTFKNIAKKGKKDIERDPRYTGDPTGKTIVTRLSFWFDNEDSASISCYDYSEEHGGLDNLTVGVQTKEQNDFLLEKAYK